MEQSKILNNSFYYGNWAEDIELTSPKKNNIKFELYSNSIHRFVKHRVKTSNSVDIKNVECNEDVQSEELNLPKFEKRFDLFNKKKYSKKIQRWQGLVESVSMKDNTFTARLKDLTEGGTDERAEIEMDDISPEDLKLLTEGALFYWSVGHFMENGQSVKRSDIRFQRLITLDSDDIDEIKFNIELKYGNLKQRVIDNKFSE
jgi:hypothetical protein